MNTTFYTTLSGFCLQCLITDLVFSQPPSIISYIGSTSVGAGVRDTWQLWGPRNSNVREPARTGPNLYSKLSGVLNSAPSDNKGYNFILLGTFYVMSTVLEITWTFTFNLPRASRSPTGAHSYEGDRERFGIGPGNEGDGFSLATGWYDAAVPTYPETAEFTPIQDVRSFNFNFVWLSPVPPDNALCVAPTPKKDLAIKWKAIKVIIYKLDSCFVLKINTRRKLHTSIIGSLSCGPIVRAIWASLGVLTLNCTEPLDTGKKWYSSLSSVATSVKNEIIT